MLWLTVLMSASAAGGDRSLLLELGGSGGLGSLSLRTALSERTDLRAGLSGMPINRDAGWVWILPVLIEGHTPGRVQLFGGIGQGLSLTTRGVPHLRGLLSAGIRHVPEEQRVSVGLAYTPLVSYLLDRQLEHWAGLQLGWRL